MLSLNGTCNTTLDDMLIGTSEIPIAGGMTFHSLGIIIAAGTTLIAILLSFYLIWMHAIHYTTPYEQRHIIRILFMVPVYATASFLSFWFYWHAIYFTVIYECYEAFAIASFFALMCHYMAPTLHDQKERFREIDPKPWLWPLSWMKKCCGGERGCWRTPRSGLTWFNIIWTGVYQYCFIRVTATITAVVTQAFGKYCESSNSPVFAHIWILVIEGVAVTIAMYCLIQFYVQTRTELADRSPFLKLLAIKLVVFLSFWQTFLISILTSSTINIVHSTDVIAYPDLVVGIPSLLICVEMAIFATLHQWAFPWQPYRRSGASKYQGGILGWRALVDAMNPWDLVKAFARGMKWLFYGVKHRQTDKSYKHDFIDQNNVNDMALEGGRNGGYKGTENLPIANEFRRSKFGLPSFENGKQPGDESAGLIAHAQPNPLYPGSRQPYGAPSRDISPSGQQIPYPTPSPGRANVGQEQDIGMAVSMPEPYESHVVQPYPQAYTQPYAQPSQADDHLRQLRAQRAARQQGNPSEEWARSGRPMTPGGEGETPPELRAHNLLWGPGSNRNV